MRKSVLFALMILLCFSATAQQNIVIYNSGNTMYTSPVSSLDSIKFDTDYSKLNVTGQPASLDIRKSYIDSITFSGSTIVQDKIYIIYNGSGNATIINPYATQGVNIVASGGHVTVAATSGISNLEYNLLGSSANGYLSMSTDVPATLVCNNLNLANDSGAAILLTGAQLITVSLQAGTTNILSDAAASSKNATLQTDGKLTFTGTGSLSVQGVKKHGISAASLITMQNGQLTVSAAASDGLHSEGFTMTGGGVTVTSSGDGIDAGDGMITISNGTIHVTSATNDVKAIKTGNGTIAISGGTIHYTVAGAQSKGLSAKGNITISGGTITATLSGITVLTASGSGFDASYCTGIKSDAAVSITGGNITIEATSAAAGARGISADGDINVTGGTINITTAGNGATYTNTTGAMDSYTSSCIKSDTRVNILAGSLTLQSSGTGGKGISSDGTITLGNTGATDSALVLTAGTSGIRFLVSGTGMNADYANPKAIKAEDNLTVNSGIINITCTQTSDGGEGLESKDTLTINGGNIQISTWDDAINAANFLIINGGKTYAYAKNNDGIDCNGPMTITGGFTISNGARAPEEGFDCDNNTFRITGGTIAGTGGNTSNPSAVSTQKTLKITTTASNHVYVKNAANQTVFMYKVPAYNGTGGNNNVIMLFTDPALANGTYTIYRGGTITGGTESHGYVTGGTYTGGTSATFTVSTYLTTVN